jgi:hypothetical protein
MALNLGSLTKYTDELATDLIYKAVLQGRTFTTGVSIQTNVKFADALNLMTSNLIGIAGGSCGYSATGSVTLSQRDLQVCPITVFENNCLNDLEQYWAGKLMRAGSYNETLPFEQVYTEEKIVKIQALIEDLFWKGSKSGNNTGAGSTTGNLTLCDGIINTLQFTSATASVLIAGSTYSGFAKADAITIIDQVINKVTSDASDILMQPDLNIYLSYGNFNTLTQALREANYFHYDANQGDYRINGYLGTNFNVIAVRGLNGTNKVVASYAANLYYGVDLENDFETFEMWYERFQDLVYFRSKFKMGAQVAFPEFIVLYKG